jgi:hypothetical protein
VHAFGWGLLWLLPLVRWPYLFGKRLLMRHARVYRARDPRPPVLLLRAFRDDHVFVQPMAGHDRLMRGRCNPWDYFLFEDMLVRLFSGCGPVIAIGRPGERVPPIGAAREWLESSQWQARVEDLLRECRLVVMVAGALKRDDGLSWEVGTILRGEHAAKLVLVMPPLASEQVRPRWEAYRELLWEVGVALPPFRGDEIAVTLAVDRDAQVLRGSDRHRLPLWPGTPILTGVTAQALYGSDRRWLGDYGACLSPLVEAWEIPLKGRSRLLDGLLHVGTFLLPLEHRPFWETGADPWTRGLLTVWGGALLFPAVVALGRLLGKDLLLGSVWLLVSLCLWGWCVNSYDRLRVRLGR